MKLRHLAAALLAALILSGVHGSKETRWTAPRLFPGTLLEATYTPTPIQSLQSGMIDLASATSNTATITSVNTSSAALIFLGNRNNNNTTSANQWLCRVALTNATTVTATRGASQAGAQECGFTVLEYLPQFIKSVQAGTISLTSVTTNTATITSVNTAKAYVAYLGVDTGDTNSPTTPDISMTRVSLQSATSVQAAHFAGSAFAFNVGYQVVEFK